MTKLITETPDHPIPFLIDHLQTKHGSHNQLQRTLSGSAALWAESETSGEEMIIVCMFSALKFLSFYGNHINLPFSKMPYHWHPLSGLTKQQKSGLITDNYLFGNFKLLLSVE